MTGSQRQSLKAEAQPFWIASVHDKKRIRLILLWSLRFSSPLQIVWWKNYSLKNFLVFCLFLTEVGWGSKKECWTVSKEVWLPAGFCHGLAMGNKSLAL